MKAPRALLAAALAAATLALPATADEGMWTFDAPPAERLRAYGFVPTREWLDKALREVYDAPALAQELAGP